MKALLVLRHAESGEKTEGQTDWDRGLTSKGIQQSKAVAAFMKKKDLIPDHIIASDAVRVKKTVELVFQELGSMPPATFTRALFETDAAGYLRAVNQAADCQSLLIAGHNPDISAFVTLISMTKVGGMGTGDLMLFHFKDHAWSKLNKGQCELMEHFVP